MPDFPHFPMHPWSSGGFWSARQYMLVSGGAGPASTSTAYPAANLAIFIPMPITELVTAYQMTIGAGATAAGNFDVGIYDCFGNRLVSSGSTAKGASTEHNLDITDTLLYPGLYYAAMAANGTNNYIGASIGVQQARLGGVLQMASAFALPATATFAPAANSFVPNILVRFRRQ